MKILFFILLIVIVVAILYYLKLVVKDWLESKKQEREQSKTKDNNESK